MQASLRASRAVVAGFSRGSLGRQVSRQGPAAVAAAAPVRWMSNVPAAEEEEVDPAVAEIERKKILAEALVERVAPLQLDHDIVLPLGIDDKSEIGLLAAQPKGEMKRKVMIYRPCQSATSSFGMEKRYWLIEHEPTEVWSNPLMGWTFTGDTQARNAQNKNLRFSSAEDAVEFCKQHGWDNYQVYEDNNDRSIEAQGKHKYQQNFLAPDVELDIKKKKKRTKKFQTPTKLASHYFRPLTFHGEARVDQHGPNGGQFTESSSSK